MSTTTQTAEIGVAEINKEQPSDDVRYTFKTTNENKTEHVSISLNEETKQTIKDLVVQNGRWRSDAQFLVDAIVFYLNDSQSTGESAESIIEGTVWDWECTMSTSMTQTLFNEIDLLVNHAHTPWSSKQKFYICALKSYSHAGFPPVNQR